MSDNENPKRTGPNKSETGEVLFSSSDIYFCSYLLALDLKLINTEKERDSNDKEKTIFVFKIPAEHLRRLKTDYFSGSGTVKALRFAQGLKTLKQMCYVAILLSVGLFL